MLESAREIRNVVPFYPAPLFRLGPNVEPHLPTFANLSLFGFAGLSEYPFRRTPVLTRALEIAARACPGAARTLEMAARAPP